MTRIFWYICQMSLIGSYVVLVVLAARLLLRKCPRRFSYLLWGLVFIRLACPIFPQTNFSIIPQNTIIQQGTPETSTVQNTSSEIDVNNAVQAVDNSKTTYLYFDGIKTKTIEPLTVL